MCIYEQLHTHIHTHIDCNAYRTALGVPFHSSIIGTYHEAGVLPLDDYRKLTCAKYILRSSSIQNYNQIELKTRSDVNFLKRAKNIRCNKTILTYSFKLLSKANLDQRTLAVRFPVSPIPNIH